MIKPWRIVQSGPSVPYRVFSVRTDKSISPRTGHEHDFYVIESRDWVNVIPLTADGRVVMVKQYRHGTKEVTLEIPGGLLDPGDSPRRAAARELLEETGYEAGEYLDIGAVRPNPAIFNNLCHTFLAQPARSAGQSEPDDTEDIEVDLVPLADIPDLICEGTINHAMVITAFSLYFLRKGTIRP